MENLSSAHAADFADRLLQKGARIFSLAMHFLCGFILSGANLFEVRVPLGVGLAAVCTGGELIATVSGVVLGSFLRLDGADRLICLIPLTGTVATVCILEKLRISRKRTAILSSSVFLLCFAVSVILMFSENVASLNGFLLYL